MRAFYLPWRTHPTQHWDINDPELIDTKTRHNHEWYFYIEVKPHLVDTEVCLMSRAFSSNGRLNTTLIRRVVTVRTEWSRK